MSKRKKGLFILWHPDSPGMRVHVHPGLLRRLGIVRSSFATSGEMRQWHRSRWIERDYTRHTSGVYSGTDKYSVGGWV